MYFIKDIEDKKFLKEIIIDTCKSLTNKNINKKREAFIRHPF